MCVNHIQSVVFIGHSTIISLNCELVLSVCMHQRRTRIAGTAQIIVEASFAAVHLSFNFTLTSVAVHDHLMPDVGFVGIRNHRTAEQEDAFFWLVV